jgi:hypothetical protein
MRIDHDRVWKPMSTNPPKILLEPSIFLQAAITAKDAEDERAIKLSCNDALFDRLADLATNHDLFISQSFMNMFLKITDELKQIKGTSTFYVPVYVFWRLFGATIGKRKQPSGIDLDDSPARYASLCDAASPNVQAYIDVADRIRAAFKIKKVKQFSFRTNIGRGYQTAGPALLKIINTLYEPALKMKNAKDSGECSPEKVEKIYEDVLDFVELEGAIVTENKVTFELLQGAGVPTSTERKPNPDLVDRDRSFLKDKFKGVKSRGFRYFISKLKQARLLLVDMKDPLLT